MFSLYSRDFSRKHATCWRRCLFFTLSALFRREHGNFLPDASTQVEVSVFKGIICLCQPSFGLDENVKTAVDVSNEAYCHPGKPACVVGYLGPQDIKRHIDHLEIFVGYLETLFPDDHLLYRHSLIVKSFWLKVVSDVSFHPNSPVCKGSIKLGRRIMTDRAKFQDSYFHASSPI